MVVAGVVQLQSQKAFACGGMLDINKITYRPYPTSLSFLDEIVYDTKRFLKEIPKVQLRTSVLNMKLDADIKVITSTAQNL